MILEKTRHGVTVVEKHTREAEAGCNVKSGFTKHQSLRTMATHQLQFQLCNIGTHLSVAEGIKSREQIFT
jgi:hypothetical protein